MSRVATTNDLNKIREAFLRSQQQDTNLPARQSDKLFVDRGGVMVHGNDVSPDQNQRLSEVHQGIFYAVTSRDVRDYETVCNKMPTNTRYISAGQTPGYLYSIQSEFGDGFTLFSYFDGTLYQVKLVIPVVEGNYNPHDSHLYDDGRLCLSEDIGMPTLEAAYAKSVAWANGFSIFERTGEFPFSINN